MSARPSTVLERILAETRVELERRKRAVPLASIAPAERTRPDRAGRPFRDALLAPGIGVIAEFKRRSPSAGSLREDPDLS
jgi:indole-3-glycerol phosphate synthase